MAAYLDSFPPLHLSLHKDLCELLSKHCTSSQAILSPGTSTELVAVQYQITEMQLMSSSDYTLFLAGVLKQLIHQLGFFLDPAGIDDWLPEANRVQLDCWTNWFTMTICVRLLYRV